MTTLNHAVTGALIAVAVKTPELAIPLALLSHYVCDAIPHFGIHEHDHVKRNASPLFRTVTISSVAGMLLLLALAPLRSYHGVGAATVVACMVAAALPDAVWVPMYIREIRSKQEKPMGRFDRFHQAIQWYEKPLGLSVEAVWLLATSYMLWFIVK